MRPNDYASEYRASKALCVSVHDVAPATWNDCLRLLAAVRAVADIPLTWLVVPRYHGNSATSHGMQTRLSALLEQGHELALHGYTHFDSAPRARSWCGRFLREIYTAREGEFAALDQTEAQRRLELGLAWFGERKWPVSGFIPPAWLLSEAAWKALRAMPFTYTTTFTRFHCLPASGLQTRGLQMDGLQMDGLQMGGLQMDVPQMDGLQMEGPQMNGPQMGALQVDGPQMGALQMDDLPTGRLPAGRSVFSPSLVYMARNSAGRLLSPLLANAMAGLLARAPLLRLSLHPRDARSPRLLRHAQRLLEEQLLLREPMTKAAFAARLTSMGPTCHHPSTGGHSPHNNGANNRSGSYRP